MVRRTSSPIEPGDSTTDVSGIGRPLTSRWAIITRAVAGQRLLVGLLDTVLAGVLAVDEPEQVRGERRLGATADLRVHALRLRLERDVHDPFVAQRLADPLGHGRLDAAGDDDVRPLRCELLAEGRRLGVVELQDPDELVAGLRAGGRVTCQLVGGGDQPIPVDRRGQQDRAGPVVDVPAPAGDLDADRGLGRGARHQEVALEDLPVGRPREQRERPDGEDRQQDQQAAAGIGATQHRSSAQSISAPEA